MGTRITLQCPKCKYPAVVSGGKDSEMLFTTKTTAFSFFIFIEFWKNYFEHIALITLFLPDF